MWCELTPVLSWPSFQFTTWLAIVTSYLETGSRLVHKCVHTAFRDWTKLFSVQYIEDYWKLCATVANSVHTADKTRQDKTVLSCRCRRCELGIGLQKQARLTASFTRHPVSTRTRSNCRANNTNVIAKRRLVYAQNTTLPNALNECVCGFSLKYSSHLI